MPGKRFRLIVGGEPFALDAPGLRLVERGRGLIPYWRAAKPAVALGYRPRNIKLPFAVEFREVARKKAFEVIGDPEQLEKLGEACRDYEAGMRRWLSDPARKPKIVFDGLWESLVQVYLMHPHSPFHGLKQNTQTCYREWLSVFVRVAGKKRVDLTIGPDLRKWFEAVRLPDGHAGAPMDRLAYGVVRQMPRVLVNFGMELGFTPCFRMNQILGVVKFSLGRKKKRVAMEYAHAEAIVKAGLARGTKQHRSFAIGQAIQFECALSQIDVVGWWEKIGAAHVVEPGDIVRGGYVWRPGLIWEHLSTGVLHVERSKTGVPGIYDLAEAPLIQMAMAAVPEAERTGPVVVDSTDCPMQRRYYIALYSELAEEAGVPAGIKNMHARHGAASEADDAGVDENDAARFMQHTSARTTRAHYFKGSLNKSRKVAQARVASRGKKEGAA